MSHSDQNTPADWPELVITGMGLPTDGPGSLDVSPPLPTNVLTGVVWLAPDACLVRSHLDQPEDEPTVINVVGTSNCDDLAGWVLMLR